jgi:hypothetical protein
MIKIIKPESQPPKKAKVIKKLQTIILLYSAKKKKANVIDEYSILYPATISASASGKSNGTRFNSASTTMASASTTGQRGLISQPTFA